MEVIIMDVKEHSYVILSVLAAVCFVNLQHIACATKVTFSTDRQSHREVKI